MDATSDHFIEAPPKDKFLVTKYPPNLISPLYLVGLSGASELGRTVARKLTERTQARPFAELYNRHFPDHVLVTEDGTCRLLRYEFCESSLSKPNMIIACGDDGIALENTRTSYDVLEELVILGKDYGASNLILIDAFPAESGELTYVTSTRGSLRKHFESKGATVMKDTHLLGPSGILLGLCRLHLLSAIGIFPTLESEANMEKVVGTTIGLVEDIFDLRYPRTRKRGSNWESSESA